MLCAQGLGDPNFVILILSSVNSLLRSYYEHIDMKSDWPATTVLGCVCERSNMLLLHARCRRNTNTHKLADRVYTYRAVRSCSCWPGRCSVEWLISSVGVRLAPRTVIASNRIWLKFAANSQARKRAREIRRETRGCGKASKFHRKMCDCAIVTFFLCSSVKPGKWTSFASAVYITPDSRLRTSGGMQWISPAVGKPLLSCCSYN